MDALGLGGIAGLLFVKEAGVPIPVPGDLVVLTAGVAAAGGSIDPALGLVVIVVAGIAGGIVQFGLVRGPGRAVLLERAAARRRSGGADRSRWPPGSRDAGRPAWRSHG